MSRRGCPDCDGMSFNYSPYEQGDGKCKYCHGTGKLVELEDVASATLMNDSDISCKHCNGTSQCQTCGGEGYVYEDDTFTGGSEYSSSASDYPETANYSNSENSSYSSGYASY